MVFERSRIAMVSPEPCLNRIERRRRIMHVMGNAANSAYKASKTIALNVLEAAGAYSGSRRSPAAPLPAELFMYGQYQRAWRWARLVRAVSWQRFRGRQPPQPRRQARRRWQFLETATASAPVVETISTPTTTIAEGGHGQRPKLSGLGVMNQQYVVDQTGYRRQRWKRTWKRRARFRRVSTKNRR